jgi:hypothetical protein
VRTDGDGTHDGGEVADDGNPQIHQSAATLIVSESILMLQ